MKKIERIYFRVSPEMKEIAKQLSATKGLDMSSYISMVLTEKAREQGILSSPLEAPLKGV